MTLSRTLLQNAMFIKVFREPLTHSFHPEYKAFDSMHRGSFSQFSQMLWWGNYCAQNASNVCISQYFLLQFCKSLRSAHLGYFSLTCTLVLIQMHTSVMYVCDRLYIAATLTYIQYIYTYIHARVAWMTHTGAAHNVCPNVSLPPKAALRQPGHQALCTHQC